MYSIIFENLICCLSGIVTFNRTRVRIVLMASIIRLRESTMSQKMAAVGTVAILLHLITAAPHPMNIETRNPATVHN